MGIILILFSALSFAFSSYFGKIMTNTTGMSGVVTSFSRFFLGAIITGLYILFTKKSFKAPDIKPIAQRAVFNSIAIIIQSSAFAYTTVTNINMLHMTYPVFVLLFAPYFTKEKIDKKNFIYLIAIMIGSYIIANPSFGNINIGDVLAFTSAIVAALSVLSLTNASKHNKSYTIIFYVMLIGTVLNIPFALKDLLNFEIAGLVPVLLAALLGFAGQIFITLGYKYVDSSTGALVSSSRTVMATLIGATLLGETITLRILTGIILITGSLVALSGFFNKKRTEEKTISKYE